MPKVTRKTTRKSPRPDDGVEQLKRNMRTRTRQKPALVENMKTKRVRRLPKKSPFSFLERSEDEVERDPNRRTPLLSLPKELVQAIASNLPLASVICLTLTCKEAAEITGISCWADYKKENQWSDNRKAFSEFLVRDWGNILTHCVMCNALHPPLKLARTHRKTKLTTVCFGQDAMIDYLPQDDTHGYNTVFLHIAEALKLSENRALKNEYGSAIDTLDGDFTITKGDLSWRLLSSGKRTDGYLVIRHVHTFQSTTKKVLSAKDLLALPIRLCPHQTTNVRKPERSRYIKSVELNGPLLTHAITAALPTAARSGVDMTVFKKPTSTENDQISSAQNGEEVYWRCRSCPTKYQVEYAKGNLVITSWHCFGRDLLHASKYWKWFVRREGKLLGPDKRNDEWWSPSRTVPDFECA
jgi:hypothetical protein